MTTTPTRTVTKIPAKPQGPAPGQPTKKKLRVAAYCRVSTDKDEQLLENGWNFRGRGHNRYLDEEARRFHADAPPLPGGAH